MQKKVVIASLVASAILVGCGGGDGASTSTSAAGAASPAPSTSSGGASPPAASAPVPAPAPIQVGEALPSLTSPQAGSTAATGVGPIGIWTASSGFNHTIAFVDPSQKVYAINTLSSTAVSELFGSMSTSGMSWTLASGSHFTLSGFVYPTSSGSGSYVPQKTFTGSYVENGTTENIAWSYDAANALSVTQASAGGTWSSTNSSFTIAADGTVTGTLSGCNVAGTMLLVTSGSQQNLYTLSLSAAPSGTCQMPAGMTYSGAAAIVFLPISGSNGYMRTIAYLLKGTDGTHIAYGQVQKQ